MKIWTDLSTALSQFARVTDGQTDRRTEFSSLDRVCIQCSAVGLIKLKFSSVLRKSHEKWGLESPPLF